MPTPVPFPYAELEFDRDGAPVKPPQLGVLQQLLATQGVTDLFVASHGWNNDMDEARDLYGRLFTCVEQVAASAPGMAGRTFAVAGVLWPSKKFADADVIPGGAAAFGDDAAADAVLFGQIDTLEALVGDAADAAAFARARQLVPTLGDDPAHQTEFAAIVLRHVPRVAITEEGDPQAVLAHGPGAADDTTLLERLGRPAPLAPPAPDGGGGTALDTSTPPIADPAGGAAGIGDWFNGVKAGAMHLLNYATYYQMKDRAGVVGRRGVSAAVRAVREVFPAVRVHLVGHSFGCRVVTAAVTGGDDSPSADVHTLALLQGAFSHFGFAEDYDDAHDDGFFRAVVAGGHVTGPAIVTHTRNDKAVGIAYAIASRIAGQIGAALGDAKDPYGGLGSNGAQRTPEATFGDLRAPADPYPALEGGRVYNLKADAFVSGHSDIANDAVAHAMLTAVAGS